MSKRSVNFHRAPKGAGSLLAAMESVGMTEDEMRAAVEGIKARALAAQQAAETERRERATWRVCWKVRHGLPWTEEYFYGRAEAMDRKVVLRARGAMVAVQQRIDGGWSD